MSTRGAYGYIRSGVKKIAFNNWDSYPSGLGSDIVDYLLTRSIDALNKDFDAITLIIESDNIAEDILTSLNDAQGILSENVRIGFILDASDFMKDTLFCEWAYIINLDTCMLEVYTSGTSLIREFPINLVLKDNWAMFVKEIEK